MGFPYVKSVDNNADKQSSWDRVFCDRKTDNANVNWIIKRQVVIVQQIRLIHCAVIIVLFHWLCTA